MIDLIKQIDELLSPERVYWLHYTSTVFLNCKDKLIEQQATIENLRNEVAKCNVLMSAQREQLEMFREAHDRVEIQDPWIPVSTKPTENGFYLIVVPNKLALHDPELWHVEMSYWNADQVVFVQDRYGLAMYYKKAPTAPSAEEVGYEIPYSHETDEDEDW